MLPSITICPWPAFKEQGFHFTNEKYENMTFKKEDLFNISVMNQPNRDIKHIDIHETRSPALGRCFTVKVTKRLSLNEPFGLLLKRSWDVIVFVHNDGEEFWLSWYPYGSFNNFQLNIKSDTEAITTILSFSEKQVEYYPSSARPCNKSSSGHNSEAMLRDAVYYRYMLLQSNIPFVTKIWEFN